jgi:hypothetical protein
MVLSLVSENALPIIEPEFHEQAIKRRCLWTSDRLPRQGEGAGMGLQFQELLFRCFRLASAACDFLHWVAHHKLHAGGKVRRGPPLFCRCRSSVTNHSQMSDNDAQLGVINDRH